jgi:hypothetical protein
VRGAARLANEDPTYRAMLDHGCGLADSQRADSQADRGIVSVQR